MDQQELEPQRNERPSHNNSDGVQENTQEREARPYYWSTKPNTGNVPKNEHPANFEDSVVDLPSIPPYSYRAQDQPSQNAHKNSQTHANTHTKTSSRHQTRPGGLSPDGDAMEHGYKPYNSYNVQNSQNAQQVPPWARPQRGNKGARIAIFVVIGLFFAKPLLILLGVLFGIVVFFVGAALVVLLVIGGFVLISLLIVFVLLRRHPFGLFRAPWQGR